MSNDLKTFTFEGHAPHPRSPARRPICARPTPIRWSEPGRRPLVRGGQSRDAQSVTTATEVWLIASMALGLIGLIVALGATANAIR